MSVMAAIFGVILVLTFALFSAIGSNQERIMLVIILVELFVFWYLSVRVARRSSKQPSQQEIEAQKEIQLLRDELGRVQKVSHQYSSRLWSLGPKLDRAEAQVKEYKAAIEQYQQEQDVLRREVEKFQGSRNPATLEAELAQCRRWQAEWRRRAEKAEAALAHISDAKGAKMFQLAKHKFAEKYHPDKAQGGRLEKQMYHEIFTDVWSIFDDIEKGKLA